MTVYSQNGWVANQIELTDVQLIPGTQRKLRLRKGNAGFLLRRIAAFIDKYVENIDEPKQDDWGYAERNIRGSETTVSNHASGTAEDINAEKHPLGVRGTWTQAKKDKIHAHLREYIDPATGKNVIRWGEDYSNRVDPMHFEIVGTPAAVDRVATKLRDGGSSSTPPPVQDKDITIHIWSIRNGCGQEGSTAPVMRITDEAYGDCRAFTAWARAKGYIEQHQEQGWVDSVTRDHTWEYGARILTDIVRRVQRANGLTVDGYFGPQTGALMARQSGYKIV